MKNGVVLGLVDPFDFIFHGVLMLSVYLYALATIADFLIEPL